MKRYWEIIADNLKKAGWSLGWVSVVDSTGRTIWIIEAYHDGKRFVARADEELTAFVQLESATRDAVNIVYWQTITMSKLRRTTER